MFLSLFSSKRSQLFVRGLHLGKHFKCPNPEDIVFNSICMNLRQRRWIKLDQILSTNLTNSLVNRVVGEFRMSPELVLGFYRRLGEQKSFALSLECSCTLIHVMVNCKRYDDALALMKRLIQTMGYSHLEILEGLCDSYDAEFSCPAVFDALVRACTQIGATKSAYEVIKTLRMEKGFNVSIHAWNNFLNHHLKSDDISRFWELYNEMTSYEYLENVYTFNLVIYALCKETHISEAIAVFYRMLKGGIYPNVVTFNMIIDGACKMGDNDTGLKLFRKMGIMSKGSVIPNSVTCNCLINGYCKSGDLTIAESIRDEMTKFGVKPDVRTYATMVDGYLRKGSMEEAFKLCSHMVEEGLVPNVVVYNSVIHFLYVKGDTTTASMLLAHMIKSNICFDKFTHSILVKGLCRNGHLNEALEYHKWLVEKNLVDNNVCLENILIHYLLKGSNELKSKVKQLVGDMFVRGLIPDTVTYGTMIDAFCKEGSITSAVEVYYDMLKKGKTPNLVIYNSIIDGLSKKVSVDLATVMVDELKKIGLLDAFTLNSLLNGYCCSGKVKEALSLFLEMEKDGTLVNKVTYNTMINFICKFGLIQEAKELMEMMVGRGMAPDSITYTILLTNACKKCSSEELIELHDDMVLKGVTPDNQTYNAIIDPLLSGENSDIFSASVED